VVALRILAVLVVLSVGGALIAFLFTRNRRFLRFAWQMFKYAVIVAAIVLALLVLERIVVAV
jgi:hypothetical protein